MADIERRTVIKGALAAGAAAGLTSIPATTATASPSAPLTSGDRRTALVTGCSSGFGRLTALTLARAGYRTYASMRDTRGANAGAVRELRAVAAREELALEVVELDVRDDRSVAHAVDHVRRRSGRIDVLVNNAGYFYPAILETMTIADVQALFDTNVFGHLRVNRAVLPLMRDRGEGLVVQVTTALGRVVFPFIGAYAGTKWAMEAMAEVSRYELRRSGIDVVIVEPGAYNTDFVHPNGTASYRRYLDRLSRTDARRRAEYGDLAGRVEDHLVEEPGLPDPQEIADTIAAIAAMPSADRPVRVLGPGVDGFIGDVHRVHEETQRAILEGSGYGDLL